MISWIRERGRRPAYQALLRGDAEDIYQPILGQRQAGAQANLPQLINVIPNANRRRNQNNNNIQNNAAAAGAQRRAQRNNNQQQQGNNNNNNNRPAPANKPKKKMFKYTFAAGTGQEDYTLLTVLL